MEKLNMLLLVEVVIGIFGVVLFFKGIKMLKTKKVDTFVITEETLKSCKKQGEMAEELGKSMVSCSAILVLGSILFIIDVFIPFLSYGKYIVMILLVTDILLFYKKLTDARTKYC